MIFCQFEEQTTPNASLRHVTVNTIVINELNQVLLTRRAPGLLRGSLYSIPGGFLERDETLQQGALRELLEETGYTGEILYLFKINGNLHRSKEDRQNMDFTFVVKLTGGTPTLNKEVTEIIWFDHKSLPADKEFAFDHRDAIVQYFSYQEKQFILPIISQ